MIYSVLPAKEIRVSPSHSNILYNGRIEFIDSSEVRFSQVGCSIKAKFHGTGISGEFSSQGTSCLYVIIDDKIDTHNRQLLKIDGNKKWFSLATGLADTIHSLEIIKTNQYDTKVRFTGLNIDGRGLVEKPEQKELFLEFYGDSNPAGHSAWDPKDMGAVVDNGGYFTYPAITARLLNAAFSNVSGGGAGITNKASWNLRDYYPLIHMNDGDSPANQWNYEDNFWGRTPDAVIINLGANDYYPGALKYEIKAGWRGMINQLRDYYPEAHIVLANSYGWAVGEPADYVHEIVEEFHVNGDDNVSFVKFPWLWGQEHAVVNEHAGFANILAQHLAEELDLPQPEVSSLSSFTDYGEVANGSFEKSTIPGTPDGWRSAGTIHLMKNSMAALDGSNYINLDNDTAVHYANDAIPGDHFLATVYMKSGSGGQGILKLEFRDQGQHLIGEGFINAVDNLSDQWQKVTITGTAPENCWQLRVVLQAGNSSSVDFDNVSTEQEVAVISNEQQITETFILEQNYPNPFNPETKINFHLPHNGRVKFSIYNIRGKKVLVGQEENMSHGSHSIIFNGEDLASGLYLYQIQFENSIKTNKCLLIK